MVLAPVSAVGKKTPSTSVIKVPNKPEVRLRNSDLAKLVTECERDTNLAQYAERRPPKRNDKTLEQKISNHKKDLLRKDLGSKKIKRFKKRSDVVKVISSGRSCISTASNAARTLKMRIPKRNPKYEEAFKNRPDLTQILHFSPIAAPPTQTSSSGPCAPQLTPDLRKRNAHCKTETSDLVLNLIPLFSMAVN